MKELPAPPTGVVVIDKPRGPTSHDVVARVRRAFKTRQVGHSGTLDPMATGVLVVSVGEGTKLVPWLTADDKAYEATVRLGIATDTLDAEGTETSRAAVPEDVLQALAISASCSRIEEALARERARTAQAPPAFSAIRIAGQRAHELARAGKLDTPLPERPIAVRALELLGGSVVGDVIELRLRVESAKGYFVRSLAQDLAEALGTVGHLTALRRTRSGAFTIGDAVALEALAAEHVIPLAVAASRALPVATLDEAGVRAARFGQRVSPEQMVGDTIGPTAWLDQEARLVAVGERRDDGFGHVVRGFVVA